MKVQVYDSFRLVVPRPYGGEAVGVALGCWHLHRAIKKPIALKNHVIVLLLMKVSYKSLQRNLFKIKETAMHIT